MDIDALRSKLAEFLRESGIETMLRLECSLTIDQDPAIKYERIDKYRVLFLKYEELLCLMTFCAKHDLILWFGADKLCIGFKYRGNMRLSAYSVPLPAPAAGLLPDRTGTVIPEIMAPAITEDRI